METYGGIIMLIRNGAALLAAASLVAMPIVAQANTRAGAGVEAVAEFIVKAGGLAA